MGGGGSVCASEAVGQARATLEGLNSPANLSSIQAAKRAARPSAFSPTYKAAKRSVFLSFVSKKACLPRPHACLEHLTTCPPRPKRVTLDPLKHGLVLIPTQDPIIPGR